MAEIQVMSSAAIKPAYLELVPAFECASGHRVADCGILGELIHAAHGEACACHPR